MLAIRDQERPDFRAVDPNKALAGAFLIMDAWKLSADEARTLLGMPPERTYFSWRAGRAVRVPADTLRRVGYLAGIYKALQIVYSDPALANSWIKRPNAHFANQPPLRRMLGGDIVDLAAVRAYLDASRAPWS